MTDTLTQTQTKKTEVKEEGIKLPTSVVKAKSENPESLILFGMPKCGKTTILSQLDDCLLIDMENGSNFVDALKVQPGKDLGPVAKFKWLKEVAAQIKAEGRPYKYVAIDTISYLDELSEWVGTYNYMNSVQGKKFNRDEAGSMLKPTHADYQSVNNLPEGYGYRWSRNAMMDIMDTLKGLGSVCTIFVCHVADKYIVLKGTNQEVRTIDLSLTGKLRNIIARDVDAIGYVYSKNNKETGESEVNISFKGNEEKVGGVRARRIAGFEGKLEWDKIFI